MLEILDGLIRQAEAAFGAGHLDNTVIKEDGLHYCVRCDQPKEYLLKAEADGVEESRLIHIACGCERAEIEAEKQAEKKAERERMIREMREDGLPSAAYNTSIFSVDDAPQSRASMLCRNYVRNWHKAKAQGVGMILHGGVGTGKTFYACCIANALISAGISAAITNVSEILQRGFDEKKRAYINRLMEKDLLIIDDLGSERDTPYALEWVYMIVDLRDKVGLPLIVTSNLSVSEMRNTQSMSLKRIYDRVLGMCQIQIKCEGESRRGGIDPEQDKVIRNIVFGGGNR